MSMALFLSLKYVNGYLDNNWMDNNWREMHFVTTNGI
jgi:hypothetical protein